MLKSLLKNQYDAIDMMAMILAGVLTAQGHFLLAALLVAPKLYYLIEYWWKAKAKQNN